MGTYYSLDNIQKYRLGGWTLLLFKRVHGHMDTLGAPFRPQIGWEFYKALNLYLNSLYLTTLSSTLPEPSGAKNCRQKRCSITTVAQLLW